MNLELFNAVWEDNFRDLGRNIKLWEVRREYCNKYSEFLSDMGNLRFAGMYALLGNAAFEKGCFSWYGLKDQDGSTDDGCRNRFASLLNLIGNWTLCELYDTMKSILSQKVVMKEVNGPMSYIEFGRLVANFGYVPLDTKLFELSTTKYLQYGAFLDALGSLRNAHLFALIGAAANEIHRFSWIVSPGVRNTSADGAWSCCFGNSKTGQSEISML